MELRAPLISNLRMDPLERAECEGMDYDHWYVDHVFARARVKRDQPHQVAIDGNPLHSRIDVKE